MHSSSRYKTLWARKEKVYRKLYEFTFQSCGACVQTNCACKDSICGHVEDSALKLGHKLSRGSHPQLRFIGANGCTVPPHLRETCTIFLCEGAQKKANFNFRTYERLKILCEKIDWKLMLLDEV